MGIFAQRSIALLAGASVASAAALNPRGGWNPWNTAAEDSTSEYVAPAATTSHYKAPEPEATTTHSYNVPAAESTSTHTYYHYSSSSSMSTNGVAPASTSPVTSSMTTMSTSTMSTNDVADLTTSPVTSSSSTMSTSSSSMSSNGVAPVSASPTTSSSSMMSTSSSSMSSNGVAPSSASTTTSSMTTMSTSTSSSTTSLASPIGSGSTTLPVPPTSTSATTTSTTSATSTALPAFTDYYSVVVYWRAREGLNPLARSAQLEANALKTANDGNGQLVHELNPGTYAQVLAPGNADNFNNVYVGGWLCERPDAPGLNGICATEGVGWDHQGQTGHADILMSNSYTQIGCALAKGVWACDLAF